VQSEAQQQTSTQDTQTEAGDEERVHVGVLAAAAAAFAAAGKQLNESDAQVAELEDDVDKANTEADKAQQEADEAKAEASSSSDARRRMQGSGCAAATAFRSRPLWRLDRQSAAVTVDAERQARIGRLRPVRRRQRQ
jgi:hypothetical protein